ncbi:MAG: cytochrome c biogenesis CcdA family protein [Chloroflexia bacterium]
MDWEFFRNAPFLLASLAAILAGLLSFFSPCVLPLVPSFLGYLAGTTVRSTGDTRRWETFFHTLAFVLGFSLVFIVVVSRLGLLFVLLTGPVRWIGGWPARLLAWPGSSPITYLDLVQKAAAIFLFLFGLHTMGLLRIAPFDTEKRLHVRIDRRWGYLSSALIGVTFAVGWTPCVGAPLAGILSLGSESTTLMTYLLSLYSLGLGLPFLTLGLFFEHAAPFVQRALRFRRAVAIASGLLLIGIALAVFFGQLRWLATL